MDNYNALLERLFQQSLKGKVFNKLFQYVICDENILNAYSYLLNSRFGYVPDISGKTIKSLNVYSEADIISKVKNKLNNYHPNIVKISKIISEDGREFEVASPSVIDRLCEQSVIQILEPIFEAKFSNSNYGHRPGYTKENAIAEIQQKMQLSNCSYVIDVVLEDLHNNINHTKLMKQLWTNGIRDKKLLSIISSMLKSHTISPSGEYCLSQKGVLQTGQMSFLLSNIYLNEFDWWIESQWRFFPTHHDYSRVVDKKTGRVSDANKYSALRGTKKNPCNLKEMYLIRYDERILIFCKEKEAAEKVLYAVEQWLQNRLRINSTRQTRIINTKKAYIDFLDFKIKLKQKGQKYVICSHIKKQSIERVKAELKKQLENIKHPRPSNNRHIEILLYNNIIRKIHNYYSLATCCVSDLSKLSNDLRYVIEKMGATKYSITDSIPHYYEEYKNQIRFFGKDPIIGLTCFKHKNAMGKKRLYNRHYERTYWSYDDILTKLLQSVIYSKDTPFAILRIKAWERQGGKCAILNKPIEYRYIDCHHVIPKSADGSDDLDNLIILNHDMHKLIHATNQNTILKYLSKYDNLTSIQLDKINKYRKLAENQPIANNC